jgi:hypothetical protein
METSKTCGMLEQVELTEYRDETSGERLECRIVGFDGLESNHCLLLQLWIRLGPGGG